MDEYDSLVRSWTRTLRRKAPKTLTLYTSAAADFGSWLDSADGSEVPEPVDRPQRVSDLATRHVHGWLNHLEARGLAPATVSNKYRALQQLFNWLVEEGELAAHPMTRMKPPKVPTKRVETVSPDDLRKLLATCSKKDFTNSRDAAIVLLYVDSGARLSEVAGLAVADIDLKTDAAYSVGKGDKPRVHSFGNQTAMAIERYLRFRAKHKQARLAELWLGHNERGPMTSNGIHQMLRRRCDVADIPPIHAHKLRHTMATDFLDRGGQEGDLMRLMGWESRQMLRRYTDTTAERRAVASHKSKSLGDELLARRGRRST